MIFRMSGGRDGDSELREGPGADGSSGEVEEEVQGHPT